MRLLSLGGGVQSSCILWLAEKEMIQPIDEAIFADTGDEPTKVYDYFKYLQDNIKKTKITILHKNKDQKSLSQEFLTDRFTKEGKMWRQPYIPLHYKGGIMQRQCTANYKSTIIIRYCRQWKSPDKKVSQLIGFSTDEIYRVKPARENWINKEYPLLELRMSRNDCMSFFKNNNIRTPEKSACWHCPYHSNKQWLDMKLNDPDSFAKAVEFDKKIRKLPEIDKHEYYLHKAKLPLEESVGHEEKEGELFDYDMECNSGHCFT